MDPYAAGVAIGRPRSIKESLTTRVCVVLDTTRDNRGLQLIAPFTRCVRAGDVLELIITDDAGAGPGQTIDRVAGIAFTVSDASGVVMVGDEVLGAGGTLGVIAGFDVSHEPNHFNVVLVGRELRTGRASGLSLADPIQFVGSDAWE